MNRGLVVTFAVVSLLAVALAWLDFRPGTSLRPERHTEFVFDEPPADGGSR